MKPLEGIDPDECRTLRDGLAETDEFIDEARREAVAEAQADDPDEEKLDRLVEELDGARHVRDRLQKAVSAGCGLKFYPSGEEDVSSLDCDDVHEIHQTLDEAENRVADSMPEWIVDDDIGFEEEAALQVQQKGFARHSTKAKDALEEFADTKDCHVPDDRNDRSPAGAGVIECNYPDPEAKAECYERRINGETNFTVNPREYG